MKRVIIGKNGSEFYPFRLIGFILVISAIVFFLCSIKSNYVDLSTYAESLDIHYLTPDEEATIEGKDPGAVDEIDRLYRENEKENGNKDWQDSHIA